MYSFVICNWKRPQNMVPILNVIAQDKRVDEFIIWDNAAVDSPSTSVQVAKDISPRIRIIPAQKNELLLGRYFAASLAKNDHIITCDDDWEISSVSELIDLYEKNTGHIIHSLKEGHMNLQGNGLAPWALVGWGAIFPKLVTECLPPLLRYLDGPLAYMVRRKADYLVTMISDLPRISVLAKGRDFPEACGDDALYRKHDHQLLIDQSVSVADQIKRQIANATTLVPVEGVECESSLSMTSKDGLIGVAP